jgi:hypothetical protein
MMTTMMPVMMMSCRSEQCTLSLLLQQQQLPQLLPPRAKDHTCTKSHLQLASPATIIPDISTNILIVTKRHKAHGITQHTHISHTPHAHHKSSQRSILPQDHNRLAAWPARHVTVRFTSACDIGSMLLLLLLLTIVIVIITITNTRSAGDWRMHKSAAFALKTCWWVMMMLTMVTMTTIIIVVIGIIVVAIVIIINIIMCDIIL